jgi:large subunit ribosomal protein L25
MSGSLRENVGKKDAKKQRAEGKVVCVLYGGEKQIHFTVDNIAFNKIIFSPDVFAIDLEIDGQNYEAILQDVQYHPVTDRTLHADFLQVDESKPVVIALPIKFTGVAPGIIKGGILNKKLRNIPVKGLVANMPEYITVDISGLNIGSSIQIKDIDFGDLECQMKESLLVVGVKTARGAVVDDDEEEDEDGEEGEAASGAEESAAE